MPWLTYAQIGERFGLGTEAARTRVRRLGWRTQPGNDGRTLALVPDDVELRPAGARADGPGGDRVDDRALDRDEIDLTGLLPGALAALEDAVAALREQLAQAERRAATAEHGRDGERQRADALRDRIDTLTAELAMAEQQAEKAEARVSELRPELEAAQRKAQEAEQAADALRAADDARRGLSRWARLRAAWRGE